MDETPGTDGLRTARLVEEDGRWVADSDTEITDAEVRRLLAELRR